jgi:hypothetical protein
VWLLAASVLPQSEYCAIFFPGDVHAENAADRRRWHESGGMLNNVSKQSYFLSLLGMVPGADTPADGPSMLSCSSSNNRSSDVPRPFDCVGTRTEVEDIVEAAIISFKVLHPGVCLPCNLYACCR